VELTDRELTVSDGSSEMIIVVHTIELLTYEAMRYGLDFPGKGEMQ
jgi:hypothetical protein